MGPHGRSKQRSFVNLITLNGVILDVTIPSTLITLSDGKSLISEYVYNQTSANSTPP